MPQRSNRPVARHAALALLLALSTLLPAPAGAAEAEPGTAASGQVALRRAESRVSAYAPALKRLQRQLLLEEPGEARRMARARALARSRPARPGATRPGVRVRRPDDWSEAGGAQGMGARASRRGAASPTGTAQSLAPNVIVNDRAEDDAYVGVGQAEQMIAALGSNVLVAWNDGVGFETSPQTSTQGYGYSVDGGVTYTDGGPVPAPAGWLWTSDPIVTVNEKTGDFWYCALVSVNSTQNGIAVAKARFNAGTVQWSAPTLVRVGSNASIGFDKPWMVADSLSGRLYLSYTVFASKDTIVFQRSNSGATAWDAPLRLSLSSEAGSVQGSRPVVAPNGDLYVTWYSIGAVDVDYMKIRKSTDRGATFAPAVDAAEVFANFSSGGPGFNRGVGVTYPSIAVDRSRNGHPGRVYLAWNECIDFYDDDLGTTGSLSETESNESPAGARSRPSPISTGSSSPGTPARR